MEGDYVFSLFGIYAPIYLAKDKIHSCDLCVYFFYTKSNTSFIYFSTITVPLLLLFSGSVVSDSIRLHGLQHGLQHIRLPCPSLAPGACSNSCPLNWWCHPTISSPSAPFSLFLHFPSIRIFSNESALSIRWPKYWSFSFSFSPSNEYSGLISFRTD